MKLIELKELGPEPVIKYSETLKDIMSRPLDEQRGASIAEVRQSIRVLDAIDKANGFLELEDADWEHLKKKVDAQPWRVIDRRILELVEDVNNA